VTDQDPAAALAQAVELLREQLDRVHRRNEELLAQLRSRADDPLIRDVLILVDSCTRTARNWEAQSSAEPTDVVSALRGVTEDLEQLLARAGVERFAPETGQAFDRRVAQVVGSKRAEDGGPSNCVLSVVRPGYRSGDRVIRVAQVVVSLAAPVEVRDGSSAAT
jgi:molecular chaperone GrpE (heat shock protein)